MKTLTIRARGTSVVADYWGQELFILKILIPMRHSILPSDSKSRAPQQQVLQGTTVGFRLVGQQAKLAEALGVGL